MKCCAVNVELPQGPINRLVIKPRSYEINHIKDQICINFCQCYTHISSEDEVHIDFKILSCIALLYFNFDKSKCRLDVHCDVHTAY